MSVLFNNTQYGLRYTAVGLIAQAEKSAARLISDLNKTVTVSPFEAEALSWTGASYILAQAGVDYGASWAIEMPIAIPSYSFVAAVAWEDESGVWQRRKLWEDVGEILNYPLYGGETLPATDVHFEIWSVEGFLTATIETEWIFNITEVELPEDFTDITASGILIATLCLTHGTTFVTLEEALGICAVAEIPDPIIDYLTDDEGNPITTDEGEPIFI